MRKNTVDKNCQKYTQQICYMSETMENSRENI